MLEQQRWEAESPKPPAAVEVRACPCGVAMPPLSSWFHSPGSPQPSDASVSLICFILSVSVLSPLFHLWLFFPLPLFSSYCPYLVRPYYLLLSERASNLWQHLVFGGTWTEHSSSIFRAFYSSCEIFSLPFGSWDPSRSCFTFAAMLLQLLPWEGRTWRVKDPAPYALVALPVCLSE